MAHANLIKWLILGALAFNLIGFLTGCKEERDAAEQAHELTKDSPGWARLRQQDSLPADQKDRMVAPTGHISSEW